MLLLGVGAAGCGDGMGDVTLTIGARSNPLTTSARSNDAEDAILSQIFAQALEDAGYAVKRNPKPLDAGRAAEAVEQGRISGYPDHLDVLLASLSGLPEVEGPSDAQTAYEQAKKELEQRGLTAFPPPSSA